MQPPPARHGIRDEAALWLNLQNDYDVLMAEHQIGKDLAK